MKSLLLSFLFMDYTEFYVIIKKIRNNFVDYGVYYMAKKKKKKHPHIDKSPVRKRKAKAWVKTYSGTDIIKDYRAHFKGVDVACAIRELQEIGYQFEEGYVENQIETENFRIAKLHKNKGAARQEEPNDFQDDNFFFIAGYTSGGAPYGVQWWEMGLEPWESIDGDDYDDEDDVAVCYRFYENLNKREKGLLDSRLRDDFSKYVSANRRLPSKGKQQYLIEKAFKSCPGEPLHYSKDFNSIYRKIVRKRENKFIQEGVLPKRFTPTELKKYFAQSVMLESERLIFRKLTADDFDDLAVMFRDPDVMAAWEHTFTDEEIQSWIENQTARYKKEIVGYFAAVRQDTGEFIGQMGLVWSDFDELCALEIVYMLKREYWGMGYATEGAAALAQYAFTEIGLNKVYCVTRPDNQQSIRVAERIGMSAGGSFIKQYNGKDMEHIIYSKDRN